jgi:hypothetical protein
MKVLYVDPLSPSGHINFNLIYIEALVKIFDSIDFAFKDGYEEKLFIPNNSKIYVIPKKYYKYSNNKIINRLMLFKIFRYIKKNFNINHYDYVIFSSYEEIALYLNFYNRNLIIINHNNLKGLNNPVKLHFFKKIAEKNVNVVFDNSMRDYLSSLGLTNIHTINHGLPKPYNKKIIENQEMVNQFSYLKNYKYILFTPSNLSVDNQFIKQLITDNEFKSFLKNSKTLLILKSYKINVDSKNIRVINSFLTDLEYQYLFLKSNLIILPYPNTFNYRVSAVLFECMTNNKMCLTSDIPALKIYKKYFNYNPSFNTVSELMNKVSIIKKNKNLNDESLYKKLNQLEPKFDNLFKQGFKITENEVSDKS